MNWKHALFGVYWTTWFGATLHAFDRKQKKDAAMFDRALERGEGGMGLSYAQILDRDIQHRAEAMKQELGFYKPNVTLKEQMQILKKVWNTLYKEC